MPSIRRIYILAAVIASLLVSCRSSKHASESATTVPEASEVVTPIPNYAPSLTDQTNFTARVRVKLRYEGQNIGTNGNLRMRMGEVIQLSLQDPILGISEIGRLEIDPTSVLVIDRYNKRYVSMTFDEINARTNRDLDYQTIEYTFWKQALADTGEELQFQFPLGSKTVGLSLSLSNKDNKSDWDAHTVPSYKYQQVSAEELFKSLSDF